VRNEYKILVGDPQGIIQLRGN